MLSIRDEGVLLLGRRKCEGGVQASGMYASIRYLFGTVYQL